MSPTPPTLLLLVAGLVAFFVVLSLLNSIAVQYRQRVALHDLASDVLRLRHSYALRLKRIREARYGKRPQIRPSDLLKPITPESTQTPGEALAETSADPAPAPDAAAPAKAA